MNYKERFNKIVKKIGDREKIDGIDGIFRGTSGYFTIKAKEMEIARGCEDDLYKIEFLKCSEDWDFIDELPEKIRDWFDYVEEKVEKVNRLPDELSVDGIKYRKVE